MNFNLENSDSDKFDHLSHQLRLWSEETDHQIVFITSDHRQLICSSKVFGVFSDLIKDIINDCDFSNRERTKPIFISVPFDLNVITCVYQLLINGICEGGVGIGVDDQEIINAGLLLNINIFDLKYEPLDEENASLLAIKTENDYSEMFVDNGLLETYSIPEEKFDDIDVKCEQTFKEEFPCPECGKVYGRKDVLRKHMRIHGITKSEPNAISYNCKECDASYSSRDKLTRHEIQHTVPDGKPFECLICETSFSRKDALTRHRKKKNH